MTNEAIDIDNPKTWPGDVRRIVEAAAATHPDVHEKDFRAALAKHKLLAYHATRLLPHEADAIRSQGLRLASPELVAGRLDAAKAAGLITEDEHAGISRGHFFNVPNPFHAKRADQVCLFVSGTADAAPGTSNLLEWWGGEVVSMLLRNEATRRLDAASRPTLVGVHVTVKPGEYAVGLLQAFVGALNGQPMHVGVVHLGRPVEAGQIVGVHYPGDVRYDAFQSFPRR